jgi:hypothetical protein
MCCFPRLGQLPVTQQQHDYMHEACATCNNWNYSCRCCRSRCNRKVPECFHDRVVNRVCGKPTWSTAEVCQRKYMYGEEDANDEAWDICTSYCKEHIGRCRRHGLYKIDLMFGDCPTCDLDDY